MPRSLALAVCALLAMAAPCTFAGARVLSSQHAGHGAAGPWAHGAELELRGHRQLHNTRRRLLQGMAHLPHVGFNTSDRATAGNSTVRPFVLTNSTPAVLPGCEWSKIFQQCQPTLNTLLAGGINMTNATFAGW